MSEIEAMALLAESIVKLEAEVAAERLLRNKVLAILGQVREENRRLKVAIGDRILFADKAQARVRELEFLADGLERWRERRLAEAQRREEHR